MGMDELEDPKDAAEGENKPSPSGQASTPPEEEDRGARVDAAKAFFRAMYAGDDPPPQAGNFANAAPPETTTQTACRNCEGLEQSLRDTEARANEAEQLYKRMAADFENYRRRMERDRDEAVAIGVKKAAEAVTPALDDLDRAMQYLSADTPNDKLIESFKLVGGRMLACLEQLGLKPIEAVGQPFDPRFHEPVQQVETTEYPDGVVMQELRRGYLLGDRVVRPALVNVASNDLPSAPPEEARLESTLLDRNALSDLEPTAPPADKEAGAEADAGRVYEIEDVPEEG
jgi:molecular chaperone GrpE